MHRHFCVLLFVVLTGCSSSSTSGSGSRIVPSGPPLSEDEARRLIPEAAGVRYEPHRYLAHHGFANETAQGPGRIEITQYDAAWAQLAWDRTMRFFGAHLA